MRAKNNIAGKSKEVDQLLAGEIKAGNADKLDGKSAEDFAATEEVDKIKDDLKNLSASDVGARPNTWMPTAEEVGARSNDWMPSVSDIGAVTLVRQSSAPTGDANTLWIDTDTNVLNYWNGSTWTPIAGTWG